MRYFKNISYLLSLISVLFFSCIKKIDEKEQLLETIKINFEDGTFFSGHRMPDPSRSGNYISKISNEIPYGGGFYFKIPDSLINKDIKVLVKSTLRTNEFYTYGHFFAITLNSSNKQMFWRQIDLDKHVENKNKWNEMIDSTLIPSTINNRAGLELKVFGFNASKKSYMEYDDIEVKLLIISK